MNKYVLAVVMVLLLPLALLGESCGISPTPETVKEKEVVVAEVMPTPEPFDCSGSEEEPRVCVAGTAGIAVEVPWQAGVGPVDVKSLPLGNIEDFPGNENFKPIRLVIDFKVIDDKGETVTAFFPGITLTVVFTEDDLKTVEGDRSDLKLGFWDEEQWNVLPWSELPNSPFLSPGPSGSLAVAKFSSWGDRLIAWGCSRC